MAYRATDLDNGLMSDAFWEDAFELDDPFRPQLITEFRRGVVYGEADGLAWGRMAVYTLSDTALWPVISRLLQHAIKDPSADYVESLSFFLSKPENISRLQRVLQNIGLDEKQQTAAAIVELRDQLFARRDDDLADMLKALLILIQEGK